MALSKEDIYQFVRDSTKKINRFRRAGIENVLKSVPLKIYLNLILKHTFITVFHTSFNDKLPIRYHAIKGGGGMEG